MKAIFILILIQAVAACTSHAQQIINSGGTHFSTRTEHYDYSIGEMVLIDTYAMPGQLLTQGFLQPFLKSGSGDIGVDVGQANNFMTPNGDGKNDVLFFDVLDKYQNNTLRIFDRAGRLLWKTNGYQNDWNGYVNGRPLNEDTYYYVLDPGKPFGLIKGFVTIIYDQSKQR